MPVFPPTMLASTVVKGHSSLLLHVHQILKKYDVELFWVSNKGVKYAKQ